MLQKILPIEKIYVFKTLFDSLNYKSLAQVDAVQFAVFVVLMFIVGTLGSMLSMELELGQSLLHYSMFFATTFLLALVMGISIAEPLSDSESSSPYPLKKPSNLKLTNPAAGKI